VHVALHLAGDDGLGLRTQRSHGLDRVPHRRGPRGLHADAARRRRRLGCFSLALAPAPKSEHEAAREGERTQAPAALMPPLRCRRETSFW
jgi:hypothetical protein